MFKGKINIDLIYEGEILKNEEHKAHYTIESFKTIFKNKNLIENKMNNNNKKNTKYIFYIVRHGMGIHNEKHSTHLIYNTELTNYGIIQASNAGIYFKKYLIENNEKINYYFTSDLQRTRQTLSHILEQFFININTNNARNNHIVNPYQSTNNSLLGNFPLDFNIINKITVHILPCSNEVHVDVNGNCNKGVSSFSINGFENYPSCTLDKIENENSSCNNIKIKNLILEFDWNIYLDFYKGIMRTSRSKECNNSNMLSEAIKFINLHKQNLTSISNKSAWI